VTNAPRTLVCRYCHLASNVSHASVHECIDALQQEGNRLREHLLKGVPSASREPQSTREHATGKAMAPRLALRMEDEPSMRDWPVAARSR